MTTFAAAAELFRERPRPKIYVYTDSVQRNRLWTSAEDQTGVVKVGFTTEDDVETRVKSAQGVKGPGGWDYEILMVESAEGDFGPFTDHTVHAALREKLGRTQLDGEWFEATVDDVRAAIKICRGEPVEEALLWSFRMRPEQENAVDITEAHLREFSRSKTKHAPHFLWNAKMRFGKTFTAYQLAKRMGWKRILVLTYKPAVQNAWQEDLERHVDFQGWQFVTKNDDYLAANPERPLVWFASFQDVTGKKKSGAMKDHHLVLNDTEWDVVVIDEYHFGAWRDLAKEIYDEEPSEILDEEFDEEVFEKRLKLNVKNYLYLSGTPFRSLANGEFSEDQIFSWTYADEQGRKEAWNDDEGPNPYIDLPSMAILTYKLPPAVRKIAEDEGTDEFDLNEFFRAEFDKADKTKVKFAHETEVQMWLDLIRGGISAYDGTNKNLTNQPRLPFKDLGLRDTMAHTLWFMPSVASCYAMRDLLERRPRNNFFADYEVVLAAGKNVGDGLAALPPVRKAITPRGERTKTITLSCGKLTTGVTVPEWTGIFMLRKTSSPETYFQSAFRVQSPWSKRVPNPQGGEDQIVLKPICYVVDFAPNRALSLIAEYGMKMSAPSQTPLEKAVADLLNYLPVICFDGSTQMEPLDAGPLLDFVASGTTMSMLALRFQSKRMVDVTVRALSRLSEYPDLIERLSNLEAFRKIRDLHGEISKYIAREDKIKDLKAKPKDLTPKERKTLTDEERKQKSWRKQLQENLLLFTARIPVFMYLTDEREETLNDIITGLRPGLFEQVTNLRVEDFALLRDLGVLVASEMEAAVFQFRRAEIPSLDYLGAGPENRVFGGYLTEHKTREELLTGDLA